MFLDIGAPTNPWKIPLNELILMKITFRMFAKTVKK